MTAPAPAEDLASLVADLLATLDGLRRAGVTHVAAGPPLELPEGAPSTAGIGAGGTLGGPRAGVGPADARAFTPASAGARVPAPGRSPVGAPPPAVSVAGPAPAPHRAPGPSPTGPSPTGPSRTGPSLGAPPTGPGAVPPAEPPSGQGLFGARWQAKMADPAADLRALYRDAGTCEACGRCRTRGRVLLGEGTRAPLLVLTGKPTLAEDAEGRLFIGEAGVMLDRMLLHVLALERRNVHVAAAAMCAGGELLPDELAACRRWLDRRLTIVSPRIVLAMGNDAARAVGAVPGKHGWSRYDAGQGAIDVFHTFHPDDLLDRPHDKRLALDHLREVRARLG